MITSITDNKINDFIKNVYLPITKTYYHGFCAGGPSVFVGDMLDHPGDYKDIYIELPLSGYSNFSGSMTERSNYQYIIETHDQNGGELPPYITGWGIHGTCTIYFNLTQSTGNQFDNLYSMLQGMTNYPILSDDMYTAVENGLILDYIHIDFTRAVYDAFPPYITAYMEVHNIYVCTELKRLYKDGFLTFQIVDRIQPMEDQPMEEITAQIFFNMMRDK